MSTRMPTAPHIESAALAVAPGAAPPATGDALPAPPAVTTATPPAARAVRVGLPPSGVTIPTPPPDYAPRTPGEFKNVVPRKAELTALRQAIIDVSSFTRFDQTVGALAPAQAEVTEALTEAKQWSAMCQATDAWMGYARLMEGLAWRRVRTQMRSLRPALALAVERDPKLAEQYGGLMALLGAPSAAARAGVAVRVANRKAVAAGEAPTHGKVGKRRQRKAEKAALAAAVAAGAPPPPTSAASAGGPSAAGNLASATPGGNTNPPAPVPRA